MKVKGKFVLSGSGKEIARTFITEKQTIRCTNCLSQIKEGAEVYVCEKQNYIYCKCYREKTTPPCRATFYCRTKLHEDIYCTMYFKKNE